MLKMMCPHCHELIISDLLAEMAEIHCSHCLSDVPVRNVLISARGMTIGRDDLLKAFFRYKKLLLEVVEERAQMDVNVDALEESKRSADQFIKTLEELMQGARDHFRMQFTISVPVRFRFDSKVQSGWLVNLSMVGACIEIDNHYFLPGIGSVISIEFMVPGCQAPFNLSGMVAWIKNAGDGEGRDIGVKFVGLTDQCRSSLWRLISASVEDVLDSAADA